MTKFTDTSPLDLGDKVRDLVSGFEGIVTGRTLWLHGCARLTVEPDRLDDNGNPLKSHTFDETRLRLIERAVVPVTARPPQAYPLGAKVRCRLNGFSGIVGGFSDWLSGDQAYIIEPEGCDKEGQPRKSANAAAATVELIAPQPVPVSPQDPVRPSTGGPQRLEHLAGPRSQD